MIYYNPKAWFGLIFKFHKSDTFRQLFWVMCSVALFCWLVAYFEIAVMHSQFITKTTFHSLLGFVLSLLLVFRTNTAYERWWEGRKLWGNLLNNSRNLAIKMHAYLPKDNIEKRTAYVSLISDYALALKQHLIYKIYSKKAPPVQGDHGHRPNQLARELFGISNELYTSKVITGDQLIVINSELQSFTDICGACERIKKTPIPYSYSMFIKKFIFVYIISMPFAFVSEFGYWVIPLTVLTFYVLASLELIAEEIEDPFGEDENDLPLKDISTNIKKSVTEILL